MESFLWANPILFFENGNVLYSYVIYYFVTVLGLIKMFVFVSGTYCNSASACFVASDGKNLRLYQAVVDARKLLDELSDPETSVRASKTRFDKK